MYNKTIWNPGDIITQEKWDNINNNLSILGAYQLPVTVEEKEEEASRAALVSNSFNITIHKTYNEIVKLLKQGVICWYYNNLNGTINYILQYFDEDKTLGPGAFYFNGVEMTNEKIHSGPIVPHDPIIIK